MQGIFHYRAIFILAENDTNRRVFILLSYLSIKCCQIREPLKSYCATKLQRCPDKSGSKSSSRKLSVPRFCSLSRSIGTPSALLFDRSSHFLKAPIKLHLADKLGYEFADLQLDGNQCLESPVKKKQINEIFIAINLQTILTSHKGEHAAHGSQKMLYPGNKRPLQFPFAMLFSQLQKIEGIFILHRKFCLRTKLRLESLIEIGLTKQGFLIALVIDLMNQNPDCSWIKRITHGYISQQK